MRKGNGNCLSGYEWDSVLVPSPCLSILEALGFPALPTFWRIYLIRGPASCSLELKGLQTTLPLKVIFFSFLFKILLRGWREAESAYCSFWRSKFSTQRLHGVVDCHYKSTSKGPPPSSGLLGHLYPCNIHTCVHMSARTHICVCVFVWKIYLDRLSLCEP